MEKSIILNFNLFFYYNIFKYIYKNRILNFPKKIMRLSKRDMALTKISIPAAVQSVYFRGKRYQYNDYLKIVKQVKKNKK